MIGNSVPVNPGAETGSARQIVRGVLAYHADTQLLMQAYITLLRIPAHKSMWRAKNQEVYCALRDGIAEALGVSAEEVQTCCEDEAANWLTPLEPVSAPESAGRENPK